MAISFSKNGPTNVPATPSRPQMVLGSRAPNMYSPRVQPMAASTRNYAKSLAPAKTPVPQVIGGQQDAV